MECRRYEEILLLKNAKDGQGCVVPHTMILHDVAGWKIRPIRILPTTHEVIRRSVPAGAVNGLCMTLDPVEKAISLELAAALDAFKGLTNDHMKALVKHHG